MSEAENSLEINADSAISQPLCAAGNRSDRLTAMAAAEESLKFIEKAGKDKAVKVRVDDRNSAILMAACLVLLLVSCWMVGNNPDSRALGIALVLIADVLCGCAILWYCILRFGFIRAIDPRYAVLCWHLILGTGVMFSFLAMNVMLGLFTFTRLQQ